MGVKSRENRRMESTHVPGHMVEVLLQGCELQWGLLRHIIDTYQNWTEMAALQLGREDDHC